MPHPRLLPLLLAVATQAAGCDLRALERDAHGGGDAHGHDQAAHVVISEVMADPAAVPDQQGEWIEVANAGGEPVFLQGWTLASGGDRGHTIGQPLVIAPGGAVVLARDGRAGSNGGVDAAYAYDGVELGNGSDWIALRTPDGQTADSVAWNAAPRRGASWSLLRPAIAHADPSGPAWESPSDTFGRGDRGTPGRVHFAAADDPAPRASTPDPEPASAAQPGVVYRDHVEFGIPRDATPDDEHLLRKPQYVLSYNPRRNVANWVSWNLNRTHFGDAERTSSFQADTTLPRGFTRVVASDYTGSGYSRGHMVRSEERTASPAENASTFLLTNVLPQHQDLNGGPWLRLESYLQEQAVEDGREIYVVAGGIFPAQPRTLSGRGKVAIPESTWKVALLLPFGRGLADVRSARQVRVIAVVMPNTAGIAARSWRDYQTTVDAIEQATGYDLFDKLPDEIEAVVEARR